VDGLVPRVIYIEKAMKFLHLSDFEHSGQPIISKTKALEGWRQKYDFVFPRYLLLIVAMCCHPLAPTRQSTASPRCTQGEVWSSVHGEDAIIIPINVESLCGKCMSELFVTVASEIKI